MSVALTDDERAVAAGSDGAAMAMRIVAEAARLLGAPRLIPIASAHIDGALYHGDSGTLFAERLVEGSARVSVRATLNVGKLAVAEGLRGLGIGRALMGQAEEIARAAGKPLIELQTRVELTGNHATFARLGFREVGRTAHAGFERPTSITMRKDLA